LFSFLLQLLTSVSFLQLWVSLLGGVESMQMVEL
jgi:hypothetical protein